MAEYPIHPYIIHCLEPLLANAAAPVVLALALFTWVCFGLLYVSSFIFWPGLHSCGTAGDRGAFDLLATKRHYPAGDCFPGQPGGPADGRRLAGGQGAGSAVCHPRRSVWLNRKHRIAGSSCPAIFLTLLSC